MNSRPAPLLLPHLFEGISNVERADLLTVLKFQKLIPAVPRHVDEYIRAVVREQAF